MGKPIVLKSLIFIIFRNKLSLFTDQSCVSIDNGCFRNEPTCGRYTVSPHRTHRRWNISFACN